MLTITFELYLLKYKIEKIYFVLEISSYTYYYVHVIGMWHILDIFKL